MTAMVALWVLGPAALFLFLSLYVAFMGLHTRDLKFRSQMSKPTPARGRRALLVNVVVPAGEPPASRPRT
ncbi:hypothetical protein E1281_05325 [Actinomadura sp. KC345]|uniref:hypothetical protein n=1 Tax=Actinomadura sp. KC345 TaxID=2530371 RepID=UPI001049A62E|nr:hypothetical protein [Actinomadura sp. KC345]TDC57301.1 hypothetical protein E1281_05325 [Actinomadura sp. KC345]